jgi:DNA uptake protein ComE-like DNA-binding protein
MTSGFQGAKLRELAALLTCIAALTAPEAMAAGEASKPATGTSTTPPAAAPMPPGHGTAPAKKTSPATPFKKVDLNNATKADLMTLPTVGAAEADKIIANRPYISKVDLVTKAGLPEGIYLATRDKVVVNDMKKPAAKRPDAKASEPK